MTAETIEFDRERAVQYDFDIRKAIPGYEALHGIELLNTAGFNSVTRFYNAFLFGGWTAKYTGN